MQFLLYTRIYIYFSVITLYATLNEVIKSNILTCTKHTCYIQFGIFHKIYCHLVVNLN